MRCASCPVPAGRPCLGETPRFASFCAWAASGDPVKAAHVVGRSAIAEGRPTRRSARPFPTLAEQAVNLAGAVARFVAGGFELATPELKARRIATCERCDRFAGGRCRECGCQLVAKIALAGERCPIGEW